MSSRHAAGSPENFLRRPFFELPMLLLLTIFVIIELYENFRQEVVSWSKGVIYEEHGFGGRRQ